VYKSFGINGKEAEIALDKIGLTLNANSVADDPLPPFRPSGIRFGTPAITTRGFKEEHMAQLAEWMKFAIDNLNDDATLTAQKNIVKNFVSKFPFA
jgi:glycine hydroxymethyltransferase